MGVGRAAAVVLGLALSFGPGVRAEPGPVQDLAYGEGLFLYFKNDYFGAITRLLAAQTREELPHQADEAELLLGGVHLSYGQQDVANAIFEQMLDERVSPAVRDRAWFYLGKMAYQRGRPEQAQEAFARIGRDLPDDLAGERSLIAAQVLMQQDRFDGAVAALEDWKGPRDWRAYARYNLGVALVRNGRSEEGTRLLTDIGGEAVPRARWKSFLLPWRLFRGHAAQEYGEREALSDKSNLALGYAYIQAGTPQLAIEPLGRVRPDGPWVNKARLGQGWAHAALEDYDAALAVWRQLENGDPLDPAVQESHLATPYALSRVGAASAVGAASSGDSLVSDTAVQGYNDAIAAFQGELTQLAASESAIASGQLLDAVLAQDQLDDMSWFWQLERLPVNAQTRHLYHVLASNGFQEGLKTFRDLRFLQRNLEEWRTGVDAFSAMLEARERRYVERLPRLEQALAEDRLDRFDERAEALAARVDEIETQRDAVALASSEELSQWARLDRVEARLAGLPDDATTAAARDRYRVLRGLVRWQLEAGYSERMWAQRKALRALDAALAEAHDRRERLIALREEVPATFEGYAARIDALAPRIDALQARADGAVDAQGGALQMLALAEVAAQKKRLGAYLTEAQYALAAVYDRAAHAGEQP
jgi:tetratricopeptide (TPR) repeat protein